MSSAFVDLPCPIGNGMGAWTDVSALGPSKTLVVGGGIAATITLEVTNLPAPSSADAGAAIESFTADGTKTVQVVAQWMRAVVSGYRSGTPDVDVAAENLGTTFVALVAPAGTGTGAAVDVATLGDMKTITVQGPYRGGLSVEVSQDNVGWSLAAFFLGDNVAHGQVQTITASAHWMRLRRDAPEISPGLPAVNVGAVVASPVVVVSPGPSKASEINAAIAQVAATATSSSPGIVQLLLGDYTLEDKIEHQNNVSLRGMGKGTRLLDTTTGAADDPTNCIIDMDGVVDTSKINTFLAVDVEKGATLITVVNVGTIATDDWLLIDGNNNGGAEYVGDLGFSDGPNGILYEIIQVASVAGNNITTKWPLIQTHAAPTKARVRGVIPVINAEVRDLQLVGNTSGGATAAGIFGRYAYESDFHNLWGSYTSRAVLDLEGVKGFRSSGLMHLGTNNSLFLFVSALSGRVWNWDGIDGVPRSHPQGFPREQINIRARCTDVSFTDGHCVNGSWGVHYGGGVNLQFANIQIRNMDMTEEAYARWTNAPDGGGGSAGFHAMGFSSGNGPLSYAEFAWGTTFSNISVEDMHVPQTAAWTTTPYRAWSHYIHDAFATNGENLHAINVGGALNIGGIRFSDTEGELTNVNIRGIPFAIFTQNVGTDQKIRGLRINCANGVAGGVAPAFFFDHSSVSAIGPTFENVEVTSNFGGLFRYGSGFLFDRHLRFNDLDTDSGSWSYAILANNATGVAFGTGDVVAIDELDVTTELRVKTPTAVADAGPGRRLAAVVTGTFDDTGLGFMLVAPFPQNRVSAMCTGVVADGDQLEYVATRRLQANVAAPVAVGCAQTSKAAGPDGMVRLGPVIVMPARTANAQLAADVTHGANTNFETLLSATVNGPGQIVVAGWGKFTNGGGGAFNAKVRISITPAGGGANDGVATKANIGAGALGDPMPCSHRLVVGEGTHTINFQWQMDNAAGTLQCRPVAQDQLEYALMTITRA